MSRHGATLLILFVAVEIAFAIRYSRKNFRGHDYLKDGRPVDGPFPSNLGNVPYFCYQAPSKGPCQQMQFRWFFDLVRRECMPMFYSGCGGNENRFNSKAECNLYCGQRKVTGVL
nr:kunitz-type serine protease inhibitor vestiginin-3-like [Plodia interpunctella]